MVDNRCGDRFPPHVGADPRMMGHGSGPTRFQTTNASTEANTTVDTNQAETLSALVNESGQENAAPMNSDHWPLVGLRSGASGVGARICGSRWTE